MAKLLMAFLGALVAVFALKYGGEIEGRIAPVMGPLDIYKPVELSPARVSWSGDALKKRECNFVRVEWFLGPRGGRRVEVDMEFTDRPEVRGEGVLYWKGIVVSMPLIDTQRNSHADALHQCKYRPWLTRTHFYSAHK